MKVTRWDATLPLAAACFSVLGFLSHLQNRRLAGLLDWPETASPLVLLSGLFWFLSGLCLLAWLIYRLKLWLDQR